MKQILSLSVLMLMLSATSTMTWADAKDWANYRSVERPQKKYPTTTINIQINMAAKCHRRFLFDLNTSIPIQRTQVIQIGPIRIQMPHIQVTHHKMV